MSTRTGAVALLAGWLLIRAPIAGPPGERWDYSVSEDQWRRIEAFASKAECETARGRWYGTFTREWKVDDFTAARSLRCVLAPN